MIYRTYYLKCCWHVIMCLHNICTHHDLFVSVGLWFSHIIQLRYCKRAAAFSCATTERHRRFLPLTFWQLRAYNTHTHIQHLFGSIYMFTANHMFGSPVRTRNRDKIPAVALQCPRPVSSDNSYQHTFGR